MHFRQWKRREFITLLAGGATVAWPLTTRAQGNVARIASASVRTDAFRHGLPSAPRGDQRCNVLPAREGTHAAGKPEGSRKTRPVGWGPCLWFCYSRSVTGLSRICWSASRGSACGVTLYPGLSQAQGRAFPRRVAPFAASRSSRE